VIFYRQVSYFSGISWEEKKIFSVLFDDEMVMVSELYFTNTHQLDL